MSVKNDALSMLQLLLTQFPWPADVLPNARSFLHPEKAPRDVHQMLNGMSNQAKLLRNLRNASLASRPNRWLSTTSDSIRLLSRCGHLEAALGPHKECRVRPRTHQTTSET
jgi:hypothetical protein